MPGPSRASSTESATNFESDKPKAHHKKIIKSEFVNSLSKKASDGSEAVKTVYPSLKKVYGKAKAHASQSILSTLRAIPITLETNLERTSVDFVASGDTLSQLTVEQNISYKSPGTSTALSESHANYDPTKPVQKSSKIEPCGSKERRSRSKERRVRSKIRDQSKERHSRLKNRGQSIDRRSWSKVRSQSKEKRSQSKERRSQPKERRSRSKELRSRSKERRSQPKERRSRSKERRSRSKERRSQPKKRRSRSKERRSQPKERRSRSKERRSQSKERRSQSKERRSRSKERRSQTKERRSRSKERRSQPKERRSRSKERRSQPKERRSRSKERRSQSKERRSQSKERRSRSKERRSQSKERRSRSKERRNRSKDRRNRSKETRSQLKEKCSQLKNLQSLSIVETTSADEQVYCRPGSSKPLMSIISPDLMNTADTLSKAPPKYLPRPSNCDNNHTSLVPHGSSKIASKSSKREHETISQKPTALLGSLQADTDILKVQHKESNTLDSKVCTEPPNYSVTIPLTVKNDTLFDQSKYLSNTPKLPSGILKSSCRLSECKAYSVSTVLPGSSNADLDMLQSAGRSSNNACGKSKNKHSRPKSLTKDKPGQSKNVPAPKNFTAETSLLSDVLIDPGSSMTTTTIRSKGSSKTVPETLNSLPKTSFLPSLSHSDTYSRSRRESAVNKHDRSTDVHSPPKDGATKINNSRAARRLSKDIRRQSKDTSKHLECIHKQLKRSYKYPKDVLMEMLFGPLDTDLDISKDAPGSTPTESFTTVSDLSSSAVEIYSSNGSVHLQNTETAPDTIASRLTNSTTELPRVITTPPNATVKLEHNESSAATDSYRTSNDEYELNNLFEPNTSQTDTSNTVAVVNPVRLERATYKCVGNTPQNASCLSKNVRRQSLKVRIPLEKKIGNFNTDSIMLNYSRLKPATAETTSLRTLLLSSKKAAKHLDFDPDSSKALSGTPLAPPELVKTSSRSSKGPPKAVPETLISLPQTSPSLSSPSYSDTYSHALKTGRDSAENILKQWKDVRSRSKDGLTKTDTSKPPCRSSKDIRRQSKDAHKKTEDGHRHSKDARKHLKNSHEHPKDGRKDSCKHAENLYKHSKDGRKYSKDVLMEMLFGPLDTDLDMSKDALGSIPTKMCTDVAGLSSSTVKIYSSNDSFDLQNTDTARDKFASVPRNAATELPRVMTIPSCDTVELTAASDSYRLLNDKSNELKDTSFSQSYLDPCSLNTFTNLSRHDKPNSIDVLKIVRDYETSKVLHNMANSPSAESTKNPLQDLTTDYCKTSSDVRKEPKFALFLSNDAPRKSEDARKRMKDVRNTSKDVQSTSKDVQSISKDIRSTPKDIQSTLKDVQSTSTDVQSISKDVRSTSKNVQSLSKDVRNTSKNPSRDLSTGDSSSVGLLLSLETDRETSSDVCKVSKSYISNDARRKSDDVRKRIEHVQCTPKDAVNTSNEERTISKDEESISKDVRNTSKNPSGDLPTGDSSPIGLLLPLEIDRETSSDVRKVSKSASYISNDARRMSDDVRKRIEDVQSISKDVRSTSEDIRSSLKYVQSISKDVRSKSKDRRSTSKVVRSKPKDVQSTSKDVKSTSKILFGDLPTGDNSSVGLLVPLETDREVASNVRKEPKIASYSPNDARNRMKDVRSTLEDMRSSSKNVQSISKDKQSTSKDVQSTSKEERCTSKEGRRTLKDVRTTPKDVQSTSKNVKGTSKYPLEDLPAEDSSSVGLLVPLETDRETSSDVRKELKSASYLFDDARRKSNDVFKRMKDVRNTSKDVQGTAKDARRSSKDVQRTSKHVRSKSKYIQSTSKDVRSTSEDIRNSSKDVQRISKDVQSISKDVQSISKDKQSTSKDVRNKSKAGRSTSKDVNSTSKILFGDFPTGDNLSVGLLVPLETDGETASDVRKEPKSASYPPNDTRRKSDDSRKRMKDVRSTLEDIRSSLKDVQSISKDKQSTSKEVQSTSKEVRSTSKEGRKTLKDVRTTPKDVQSTLKNVKGTSKHPLEDLPSEDSSLVGLLVPLETDREISSDVRKNLKSASYLSDDARRNESDDAFKRMKDVRSNSKDVRRTAKDARRSSKDVQRTSKYVRSKSKDVQSTSKDVRSTSEDIRNSSKDVQRISKDVQSISKDKQSTSKDVRSKSKAGRSTPKGVRSKPKDVQSTSKDVKSTSKILFGDLPTRDNSSVGLLVPLETDRETASDVRKEPKSASYPPNDTRRKSDDARKRMKDVRSTLEDIRSSSKDVRSISKDKQSTSKEVQSTSKEVRRTSKEGRITLKDVRTTPKDVQSTLKDVKGTSKHPLEDLPTEDSSLVGLLVPLETDREISSDVRKNLKSASYLSDDARRNESDDAFKRMKDVRSNSKDVRRTAKDARRSSKDVQRTSKYVRSKSKDVQSTSKDLRNTSKQIPSNSRDACTLASSDFMFNEVKLQDLCISDSTEKITSPNSESRSLIPLSLDVAAGSLKTDAVKIKFLGEVFALCPSAYKTSKYTPENLRNLPYQLVLGLNLSNHAFESTATPQDLRTAAALSGATEALTPIDRVTQTSYTPKGARCRTNDSRRQSLKISIPFKRICVPSAVRVRGISKDVSNLLKNVPSELSSYGSSGDTSSKDIRKPSRDKRSELECTSHIAVISSDLLSSAKQPGSLQILPVASKVALIDSGHSNQSVNSLSKDDIANAENEFPELCAKSIRSSSKALSGLKQTDYGATNELELRNRVLRDTNTQLMDNLYESGLSKSQGATCILPVPLNIATQSIETYSSFLPSHETASVLAVTASSSESLTEKSMFFSEKFALCSSLTSITTLKKAHRKSKPICNNSTDCCTNPTNISNENVQTLSKDEVTLAKGLPDQLHLGSSLSNPATEPLAVKTNTLETVTKSALINSDDPSEDPLRSMDNIAGAEMEFTEVSRKNSTSADLHGSMQTEYSSFKALPVLLENSCRSSKGAYRQSEDPHTRLKDSPSESYTETAPSKSDSLTCALSVTMMAIPLPPNIPINSNLRNTAKNAPILLERAGDLSEINNDKTNFLAENFALCSTTTTRMTSQDACNKSINACNRSCDEPYNDIQSRLKVKSTSEDTGKQAIDLQNILKFSSKSNATDKNKASSSGDTHSNPKTLRDTCRKTKEAYKKSKESCQLSSAERNDDVRSQSRKQSQDVSKNSYIPSNTDSSLQQEMSASEKLPARDTSFSGLELRSSIVTLKTSKDVIKKLEDSTDQMRPNSNLVKYSTEPTNATLQDLKSQYEWDTPGSGVKLSFADPATQKSTTSKPISTRRQSIKKFASKLSKETVATISFSTPAEIIPEKTAKVTSEDLSALLKTVPNSLSDPSSDNNSSLKHTPHSSKESANSSQDDCLEGEHNYLHSKHALLKPIPLYLSQRLAKNDNKNATTGSPSTTQSSSVNFTPVTTEVLPFESICTQTNVDCSIEIASNGRKNEENLSTGQLQFEPRLSNHTSETSAVKTNTRNIVAKLSLVESDPSKALKVSAGSNADASAEIALTDQCAKDMISSSMVSPEVTKTAYNGPLKKIPEPLKASSKDSTDKLLIESSLSKSSGPTGTLSGTLIDEPAQLNVQTYLSKAAQHPVPLYAEAKDIPASVGPLRRNLSVATSSNAKYKPSRTLSLVISDLSSAAALNSMNTTFNASTSASKVIYADYSPAKPETCITQINSSKIEHSEHDIGQPKSESESGRLILKSNADFTTSQIVADSSKRCLLNEEYSQSKEPISASNTESVVLNISTETSIVEMSSNKSLSNSAHPKTLQTSNITPSKSNTITGVQPITAKTFPGSLDPVTGELSYTHDFPSADTPDYMKSALSGSNVLLGPLKNLSSEITMTSTTPGDLNNSSKKLPPLNATQDLKIITNSSNAMPRRRRRSRGLSHTSLSIPSLSRGKFRKMQSLSNPTNNTTHISCIEANITPNFKCAALDQTITKPYLKNAIPKLKDAKAMLHLSGGCIFESESGKFKTPDSVKSASTTNMPGYKARLSKGKHSYTKSTHRSKLPKPAVSVPVSLIPLPEPRSTPVAVSVNTIPHLTLVESVPVLLCVAPVSNIATTCSQHSTYNSSKPLPTVTSNSIAKPIPFIAVNTTAIPDTSSDTLGISKGAPVPYTGCDYTKPCHCTSTTTSSNTVTTSSTMLTISSTTSNTSNTTSTTCSTTSTASSTTSNTSSITSNTSSITSIVRSPAIYYACDPPKHRLSSLIAAIRRHKAEQDTIQAATNKTELRPKTIPPGQSYTTVPINGNSVSSTSRSNLPDHANSQHCKQDLINKARQPGQSAEPSPYIASSATNYYPVRPPVYTTGHIRQREDTTAPFRQAPTVSVINARRQANHVAGYPRHTNGQTSYSSGQQRYRSTASHYTTGQSRYEEEPPNNPSNSAPGPTLSGNDLLTTALSLYKIVCHLSKFTQNPIPPWPTAGVPGVALNEMAGTSDRLTATLGPQRNCAANPSRCATGLQNISTAYMPSNATLQYSQIRPRNLIGSTASQAGVLTYTTGLPSTNQTHQGYAPQMLRYQTRPPRYVPVPASYAHY